MSNLAKNIVDLLQHGQVLTIQVLEDGLMISLADTNEWEQQLVFVPEEIMLSKSNLEEAVSSFHTRQMMQRLESFVA
jgi:hypothetical protein